jgi:polyhydroxyalkanoate synthase subunit PhaC
MADDAMRSGAVTPLKALPGAAVPAVLAPTELELGAPLSWSGWPIAWMSAGMARAFDNWPGFSQLGFPGYGSNWNHVSAAPPRRAPDGAPEVDPPATIDRLLHAAMGRLTSGISPAALALAYADWALHFWGSPGKQQQLVEKAVRKAIRFAIYVACHAANAKSPPCIAPLAQDDRFTSAAWQQWPFNAIYQGFLLNQQWWYNATTGIGGVSPHHQNVVSFAARQLLDIVSPANFIATNPELLEVTLREGGRNLLSGTMNFLADWERTIGGKPPLDGDAFEPGRNVAVTPGEVVYRNRLMELIQYEPTTEQVHREPVLIVPAWIMKYYILDLSPENSLVKYLVDHGHTVFMISWHNPTAEDRDLGMDDYLHLGVLEALNVIQTIVPDAGVNAVGYCLGGTLLAIAAAFLAREKNAVFNCITLLAAQTDFSEAGELMLFIDDSELNYLEDIMWDQGYLDTRQMSGAFQLLRSTDLVWSRVAREYLMGRRAPMNDLMAWNADATRMPFRMHREYLRHLFLGNDLFEGRYNVNGRPIALHDICTPLFAVATERDHVAPWRSVYKINLVSHAEVTFLLTSGGHNAGIVSEPGHKGRHYRVVQRGIGNAYVDSETWFATTASEEGSWWPAWMAWLDQRTQGFSPPPRMGVSDEAHPLLGKAPGRYVHER